MKDTPSPPPIPPPPPPLACHTSNSSGNRTQTQCHPNQKMSVPTATRGSSWHFATRKQTETGEHPDCRPVSLEHTSQEKKRGIGL